MAASRQDISDWFELGVKESKTHMLVVCDMFDYEDYPVYVSDGESAEDKANEYQHKSMQKVMEVYDLRMDKTEQMKEFRAWHTA